jgi:hypothetical protein
MPGKIRGRGQEREGLRRRTFDRISAISEPERYLKIASTTESQNHTHTREDRKERGTGPLLGFRRDDGEELRVDRDGKRGQREIALQCIRCG